MSPNPLADGVRRQRLKWIVPVAILGVGAGLIGLLVALRPVVEPGPPNVDAPLVRTVIAEPREVRFTVRTQGTVKPRTESDLVPQVSGEVIWVSPELVAGGFFEEGQPLARIDRADYEAALESARAAVARAESERHRSKRERARQQRLAERNVASDAEIDDAENAFRVAEASLREARAHLERAERDLTRTELRAPYAGRVRSEMVDAGQFASRGQALARLYAVDYAEVRLPLPDRELAYLDLPLAYRTERRSDRPERGLDENPVDVGSAHGPETDPVVTLDGGPADDRPAPIPHPSVLLHAEFAGQSHTWLGKIVRTEGELDPKSRMVHVVARVEDPYGRDVTSDRPPLAVGLFVEAEIEGRTISEAFVLPRTALRRPIRGSGDLVLIVDDESRLHFRPVELLRAQQDQVVVGEGLRAGERICVSPIRAVVDGMRVRVADDPVAEALAGAKP